jgi:hypothetical protein
MSGVDVSVGINHRERALARNLGTVALVAIAWFLATAVAVQVLREDLDWIRVPLSFYLIGPYGPWLQFAYVSLATAIAVMAIGYYRVTLAGPGRQAVLVLFMLGSMALAITAQAETDLGGGRALTTGAVVHAISAPLAFLFTALGMLWQSWRFRSDPHWRSCFAVAFCLALFCFAALWVLALWRELPRGLSQKLVVLAILAWLSLAAGWLRQQSLMNPD